MPRLLLLFDLDGTLLVDDAYAHGRAMVQAARSVWQVDLPDDAVLRIAPRGKTDRQILRDMLATVNVREGAVDERLAEWESAAAEAFATEAEAVGGRWRPRPGVDDALRVLGKRNLLTLLTGNLRPIAEMKVARMGIAGDLELDAGAFGSDSEDRADLVPLARARAGGEQPWPSTRAVLVGDTPADVEAAHADRVACILFESDQLSAAEEARADAVVADPATLTRLLSRWQAPEDS